MVKSLMKQQKEEGLQEAQEVFSKVGAGKKRRKPEPATSSDGDAAATMAAEPSAMEFERAAFGDADTAGQQVEVLLRMERSMPPNKQQTSTLKTFRSKLLKPVLACYREHYKGNLEAFSAGTSRIKFTSKKFKCACEL